MPKIIKQEEFILFEGVKISDFLDKNFLSKLKSEKLEVLPVSLVLIAKEKVDGKETEYPIILGHENEEEINKKIIHIRTPTTEASDKIVKLLEKLTQNVI